jgi:hypothetical protein
MLCPPSAVKKRDRQCTADTLVATLAVGMAHTMPRLASRLPTNRKGEGYLGIHHR